MSSVPEPAGPGPRAQVVARNSIWLTLDSLVAIPVSLALSILVARSIGPDVLDLYNFANWTLGAGVVVVTNGVTYGAPAPARALLRSDRQSSSTLRSCATVYHADTTTTAPRSALRSATGCRE